MRIVTGFMPQTSGEALVRGFDVEEQSFEAKRLVGHLPENAPCSSDMTASGFLKFCGEARGLRGAGLKDGVDRAITTCFLEPFVHPSINPLSKGYRHRLGLARARQAHERRLSLTDCVSFEVMSERGYSKVIADDEHLGRLGYRLASDSYEIGTGCTEGLRCVARSKCRLPFRKRHSRRKETRRRVRTAAACVSCGCYRVIYSESFFGAVFFLADFGFSSVVSAGVSATAAESTHSRIAMGAASLLRAPIFTMRV